MKIANIMPQLQRAQSLLQAGQAEQAWSLLAPLRTAIRGHAQALRLYALGAQSAGRVDETVDALQQIAALENDPPEIIGAIADTLGNAGRHDEALTHWDKLVARNPGIADAHLNRAITAANAGKQDLAIAAADLGLRHFPGHGRLLATKAMALKNAGRTEEAVAEFAKAVAADPDRALTRYNQGVTLRAACRYDEACDAYAGAAKLGLSGAQFHADWAAAALEKGDVDAAASLYGRALAEDPGHKESLKALTRLEIEYRGGANAFAHFEQSVDARGGTPEAWSDWIGALSANNRLAEAAEVAARALAAHPGRADLEAQRLSALGMVGDAGAAFEALEALTRNMRQDTELNISLAQLALRGGRPDRASAILEPIVEQSPNHQLAWALLSVAWRLLGDPREAWLCDYERLVMAVDVCPAGGGSASEYAEMMADVLESLHATSAAPGDQSLRGGTQTSGALFDRPLPEIQEFRENVLSAAAKAVADLPDDPTHPFLRRKSPDMSFSGSWSVRLTGGGHHVSHMHGEGWMSSAYYARLPGSADRGEREHAGWIQFGAPPEHFGLCLDPRRIVEPRPGRLVLFPSYMWHGTIPFAAGDRLTAAFDYQPR